MKPTTMKTEPHTLVKFLYNEKEGDLFAYFPGLNYNKRLYGTQQKTCYAHLGQHSSCTVEYAKQCRPATPAEYADLKKELEQIGYKLKVCKN